MASGRPASPTHSRRKPRRPIIALLTDFGCKDPYVASIRGVISCIAPESRVVDISHDVLPQNITQASYLLWACFRYFPPGTIFVCIVDPGVGTRRRIVCLEGDGYQFLAPDNGLLHSVLTGLAVRRIVAVENRRYFLKDVSPTFHGRDIFAPVAAHLSRGVSIAKLGRALRFLRGGESLVQISPGPRAYQGRIIHIDHFGNLVTNFHAPGRQQGNLRLRLGRRAVEKTVRTYAEARDRSPFLVVGSTNLIEVSVRNGSAARALRAHIGQDVALRVS